MIFFILIFILFSCAVQGEELCSFSEEFKGEINNKIERELKEKALEKLIYDYVPDTLQLQHCKNYITKETKRKNLGKF